MKLIAGIITYNDGWNLRDTIKSVVNVCDKVIIVDGAYELFPDGEAISNDNTYQVVDEITSLHFNVTWISRNNLWKGQDAKRNEYLEFANPDDWIFVIDADEVLIGDTSIIRHKLSEVPDDVDLVKIWNKNIKMDLFSGVLNRFIRYSPGMHYCGKHFRVCKNESHESINKRNAIILPGDVYLEHRNHLRPPERNVQRLTYRKLMRKRRQREP